MSITGIPANELGTIENYDSLIVGKGASYGRSTISAGILTDLDAALAAATSAAADAAAAVAAVADATASNAPDKIVRRDSSGDFSAGTITADLTGNAATATRLAAERTISVTGDATGGASFDGSASASIALTLASTGVSAGAYGSDASVPTITVDSKGRISAAAETAIRAASTTAAGVVQLSTATNSTSATQAATPSAVKTAYDLADAALPKAGGTVSGNLSVSGNLVVTGSTITTTTETITVTDPVLSLGGSTAPTVNDGKDRGVEYRWHNGAAAKLGFFGHDASTGYWTFIPDATNSGGVFSGAPGTIQSNLIGAVTGNASTATKLATARTISATGDATGSASFDGSANAAVALTLANSGATAGSYGSATTVPALTVDAKGRVTSAASTAITYPVTAVAGRTGAITLAVADITGLQSALDGKQAAGTYALATHTHVSADITDATSASNADKIVKRDSSGNFSAGTITAALAGNAATATKLATARTLSLSGAVTGSATFDGSANAAIATTLAAHTHTIANVTGLQTALSANPKATSVTSLLADMAFTYTAGQATTVVSGDIIRTVTEGFAYRVASSTATDHHVTTAGGVKLYVLPGGEGYNLKAFGADPTGVANCQPAMLTAIRCVCNLEPGASFTTNLQGGGRLFVPAGVYRMDSIAEYVETASRKINFQIVGEGSFQSVIYASATNTTGCVKVRVSGGNEGQFLARDLSFVATAAENGVPLHFEVDPVGLSRQIRCFIDNVQVRPLDPDGQWFSTGITLRGFYYPSVSNCTVSGPYGSGATSPTSAAYADTSLLYRCDVGFDLRDCYDPTLVNNRAWSCDVGYDLSNTVNPGSEGAMLFHSGCSRVRVGIRKISVGREPGFIVSECHINFRDYAMDLANLKDVDILSNLTFNENTGQYGTGGTPYDIRLRGCQDVTVRGNRFQFAGDARRVPVFIDNTFGNTEGIQEHRALRVGVVGNDFAADGAFAGCVNVAGVSDYTSGYIVLREFVGNTYDTNAIASPITLLAGGDPISWLSHKNGRTIVRRTGGQEVVGIANDGDMLITNGATGSGQTPDGGAGNLVIDSAQTNFGMSMLGSATSSQSIYFGDTGSPSIGRLRYLHSSDTMQMRTGGTDVLNLNATTTDNETAVALLVRVGGASSIKRVSVGAADSGGTGYRILRVPN